MYALCAVWDERQRSFHQPTVHPILKKKTQSLFRLMRLTSDNIQAFGRKTTFLSQMTIPNFMQ
jgi:hypothetical protein